MANDALMAGIDTTGNASAFLLYHLASNPEHQERLHQVGIDRILNCRIPVFAVLVSAIPSTRSGFIR